VLESNGRKFSGKGCPKIFVTPVEVYQGLMWTLRNDSTGYYRESLSKRHIFVSENMFQDVDRIERGVRDTLPPELPPEPPEFTVRAAKSGPRKQRWTRKKPVVLKVCRVSIAPREVLAVSNVAIAPREVSNASGMNQTTLSIPNTDTTFYHSDSRDNERLESLPIHIPEVRGAHEDLRLHTQSHVLPTHSGGSNQTGLSTLSYPSTNSGIGQSTIELPLSYAVYTQYKNAAERSRPPNFPP